MKKILSLCLFLPLCSNPTDFAFVNGKSVAPAQDIEIAAQHNARGKWPSHNCQRAVRDSVRMYAQKMQAAEYASAKERTVFAIEYRNHAIDELADCICNDPRYSATGDVTNAGSVMIYVDGKPAITDTYLQQTNPKFWHEYEAVVESAKTSADKGLRYDTCKKLLDTHVWRGLRTFFVQQAMPENPLTPTPVEVFIGTVMKDLFQQDLIPGGDIATSVALMNQVVRPQLLKKHPQYHQEMHALSSEEITQMYNDMLAYAKEQKIAAELIPAEAELKDFIRFWALSLRNPTSLLLHEIGVLKNGHSVSHVPAEIEKFCDEKCAPFKHKIVEKV